MFVSWEAMYIHAHSIIILTPLSNADIEQFDWSMKGKCQVYENMSLTLNLVCISI